MTMRQCSTGFQIHLTILIIISLELMTISGCSPETATPEIRTVAGSAEPRTLVAGTDHTDHEASLKDQQPEQHDTQPAPPVARSSQPDSFSEAVACVVRMNEQIKAALADRDRRTADDHLHALGRTLEKVSVLAEDAELTFEQCEAVHGAVVRLLRAFGAVDATMHGGVGMSYEEVSIDIEENLELLKSLCAEAKTTVP